MNLDWDAFEERSAIIEYDGGLSRFRAETLAAEAQGFTRWQAIEEIRNAIRERNSKRGGDKGPAASRNTANNLSGVQRAPEKENRPMFERHIQAGRSSVVLLALLIQGWPVL